MTTRVAVIGAGVVGLAAAWALERKGYACLVFEHGAPGGGQSAGESRIFRHVHDDRRQFELAVRARRGWSQWEAEFGVQLISADGGMVLGEEGVNRLARYAGDAASRVRELSASDIKKLLPILADYDGPALIDESAGAIRTRLTIANLIGAVGLNLVPERVESITPREDGGVAVVTSFGPRTFDAVVVAAGVGTAGLAATAGVEIPSSQQAHMRLTLPLRDGFASRLACIQDSSGAFGETTAYGSPVRGNREYAVGLALSTDAGPSAQDTDELADISRRTSAYIERAMPGLDMEGAVALQRWITELPWAADGLAIWQAGDAYFIAGHNLFKLAPALGTTLSDCVAAGRVPPGFRPEDRLGRPTQSARPTG